MGATEGKNVTLAAVLRQALDALTGLPSAGDVYPASLAEAQSKARAAIETQLTAMGLSTTQASRRDPMTYELKAVTFDLAPEGTAIPAYLNERRWNGFRMPYFPECSMPMVMQLCADVRRHPDIDAYVICSDEAPEDAMTVPAETIRAADGADVKVYPVGAGAWVWELAD